jgi:RNA recognition motif-containing protein
MTIYVGNLSYSAKEEDVKAVFAEYGTVTLVKIPTDRETGKMRGFGFVDMEKETEETAAIEALDGAQWMDRELKVNKARPKMERRNSDRGNSRQRY